MKCAHSKGWNACRAGNRGPRKNSRLFENKKQGKNPTVAASSRVAQLLGQTGNFQITVDPELAKGEDFSDLKLIIERKESIVKTQNCSFCWLCM